MISYVNGKLVHKGVNYVIIDINGIGYQINTYQHITTALGEMLQLFTHLYVREDELALFGFKSEADLQLFLKIITVKGIGAKTAATLFQKADSQQIIKAIDQEDVTFLKTLPGIGQKSAAQMVLDLKGKLVSEMPTDSGMPVIKDVLEGLKYLGYKANQIHAIEARLKESQLTNEADLMKLALQLLQ